MKKPNIVFFLSDDHGQWANGTYGNKEVITKNIDALAENGVKFTNFYCTSPVCSPSRASILTGKIPSQHGVHDWICGGNLNFNDWSGTSISINDYLRKTKIKDNKYKKLLQDKKVIGTELLSLSDLPEWKNEMRNETCAIDYLEGLETYTNVLAQNGYHVALSGKWHLGATSTKQCGYKTWMPVARGGTAYMSPEMLEDGKVVIKDEYVTDLITENAINFLDDYKSQAPFYLSVHYTAPHSPWEIEDQKPEIWNLYKDMKLDNVNDTLHENIASDAPAPRSCYHAEQLKKGYYSAITAMDQGIGRVVSKLDELGIADETIIIYTSDNGINLGQHGVWGKGNGTFPLNFYEESIKVPFIYYNPKSQINKVEKSLISQYDIFPTIMDICNIPYEFDKSFPGSSFNDLLKTEESKWDPIVVYDEYGPNRMIRNNSYKYVRRYPYGNDEFYDLKIDENEKNNLIDNENYREKINEMRKELEIWFQKFVNPNVDGISTNCYGVGQTKKLDRKMGENMSFRIRK